MTAVTTIENKNNIQKNIVIVGGGFAGVTLARKLEKTLPSDWDIFLLSKTNFITYNPLLPEVIGASILPGHVQSPIRQILKRTRMRMVTVDWVDHKNKTVHYHNDDFYAVQFDQLVYCSGVKANTKMIAGLDENSLPLKTVGDALYIRNRIIERLEQSTIHSSFKRRKQLTTFIIIGGGFSGVETAGEINDFLKSAQKYYKNVKRENCKIILIHSGDRLLPELTKKLGEKTLKIFKNQGIDVRLNQRAKHLSHEKVLLQSGQIITGATIICTIGTTPHEFVNDDCLPINNGKVMTQSDMSIKNNPGVWAIGDCALVPNALDGKLCPATAQFADRQAKALAKNILARLNKQATKPFSYKPMGMMASIGHNKAVAEIFGFRVSGIIGFMLWRGVYLLKVPTFSRKIRLFLEWNWSMFFPPDIAHLGFKKTNED
jgi:NADH dehydrogenase